MLSLLAVAMLWLGTSALRKRRDTSVSDIGGVRAYFRDGDSLRKWVLFFGPGATDATIEAFCADCGRCQKVGHPSQGGIAFAVVQGEIPEIQPAVMGHGGEIDFVEHDAEAYDDDVVGLESASEVVGLESASEASLSRVPWGVGRVGTRKAGATGKGVNIYVLDSGVRVTHEDFGGRAIPTLNAWELDMRVCEPQDAECVADTRGHGTHVAGSAAGTTMGVAPEATIRAVNRGYFFSDAFACMDWIITNRVKPAVVTMSFGKDGKEHGSEIALNLVVEAGITVTVSAGNDGHDACQNTWAFIPAAISVASSTYANKRAKTSNFGACTDIFAPGSMIVSADHRSDTKTRVDSGTSMATPHVAGGVAVILQGSPELTPQQVLDVLRKKAKKNAIGDVSGSPNLLLNVAA